MEIGAGDGIQFRVSGSGTKLIQTETSSVPVHQEGTKISININITTIMKN